MLVKLELDPARLQLLSGFIDAYLPLEPREEMEFKARAATGTPEEREAVMELTNSWIERGREEGLERGREEGREKGREEGREESRQREAELACRLLQKRIGSLTPERENIIRGLPVERLERLVEAIFEIEAEADLDRWL